MLKGFKCLVHRGLLRKDERLPLISKKQINMRKELVDYFLTPGFNDELSRCGERYLGVVFLGNPDRLIEGCSILLACS